MKISNKNKNTKDLLYKYIHKFKNIKFLDENIINNIRNMSDADKMEIILTNNDVIEMVENFFSYFLIQKIYFHIFIIISF